MFDILDQLEIFVKEASLHTRMAIMFLSIAVGIALSQLAFSQLRKLAVKVTNGSYPLVQRAFRGNTHYLGRPSRRIHRRTNPYDSSQSVVVP